MKKEMVVDKNILDNLTALARFPEENPNPVMRIDREYRLVYANSASRFALDGMSIEVGDIVPEGISSVIVGWCFWRREEI